MKGYAITLGLGAMVGAVAILMMPRNNPTRKLAVQTAAKVEDAAAKISNKITQSTSNS